MCSNIVRHLKCNMYALSIRLTSAELDLAKRKVLRRVALIQLMPSTLGPGIQENNDDGGGDEENDTQGGHLSEVADLSSIDTVFSLLPRWVWWDRAPNTHQGTTDLQATTNIRASCEGVSRAPKRANRRRKYF